MSENIDFYHNCLNSKTNSSTPVCFKFQDVMHAGVTVADQFGFGMGLTKIKKLF
jgi:hypothetical protein